MTVCFSVLYLNMNSRNRQTNVINENKLKTSDVFLDLEFMFDKTALTRFIPSLRFGVQIECLNFSPK